MTTEHDTAIISMTRIGDTATVVLDASDEACARDVLFLQNALEDWTLVSIETTEAGYVHTLRVTR